MTAQFAYRTATSADLCSLNAERCHICSGKGMRARTAFDRGDGCLVQPPHLRSDPVVMRCWLDNNCEEVTEHTDWDSHYGRNDLLHKASPLSVGVPQTAWVIQFYRQAQVLKM